MEKISKLIPKDLNSFDYDLFSSEPNPLNPIAVEIVNKLFALFFTICRGFEKQFQDSNKLNAEKTQWYRVFTDENLTDSKRLNVAVKKFRIESPINTPTISQFINWYQPTSDEMGLLTKEHAFNRCAEFIRNGSLPDLSDNQNLLMSHVIKESDSYFLRHNSINTTQPVFFRNYEIAIRDFLSGKLKPIPKAIENKSVNFTSDQLNRWKNEPGFYHANPK